MPKKAGSIAAPPLSTSAARNAAADAMEGRHEAELDKADSQSTFVEASLRIIHERIEWLNQLGHKFRLAETPIVGRRQNGDPRDANFFAEEQYEAD